MDLYSKGQNSNDLAISTDWDIQAVTQNTHIHDVKVFDSAM